MTTPTGKLLGGTGRYLDDRVHGARGLRVFLRKIFPDHWSFLLGEIALYSFIILLLTGTFLTLFFQPSMTDVPTSAESDQCRKRPVSDGTERPEGQCPEAGVQRPA